MVIIADRMGDASIEPDAGMKKAEQLMSSNLSGSQLDLFLHGEGDPFAPGHVEPHQYENQSNSSPLSGIPNSHDTELNKMFLESEKNRISRKPNANNNNSDIKEYGEPTTETSTL